MPVGRPESVIARVNWPRVLVGGLLWAAVYSIVGGPALLLFLGPQLMLELERMGRPLELNADSLVFLGIFGVLFTVSWGIVSIWFYAAIRPRYGPGPKTAVIAAVGVWFLSIAAPVSHLAAFGIASARFVAIDLPTELVAILAATLVGAWRYSE